MDTFTASLGVMIDIPQWFTWELRWDAIAGKFTKAPWREGRKVDASQLANWMSYTDAVAMLRALPQSPELRYALGFWLTADCGYFLLDLDHALGVDGQWRRLAQQMVAAYPGAMCEVSSSGRGLHVIGRTSALAHRNKPPREIAARLAPLQLELYTANRGICFGLDGHAQGCADAAFDLAPLVSSYFPPHAPGDYNGQRMAQWRGPEDDNELIERALRARQSAAAAFGGKASFTDLWHGRIEKNSEADAALAARLAWWTGADAPRVERLMRLSAARRDKWDERRGDGTYLSLTIQRACELCTSCYVEPQALPLPARQPCIGLVQNAADLQRRTFTPISWALHELLPEGVTLLSSDPKLGKSWMALGWSIAIASGKPIWDGRVSEQQGDALLLALEDNDRRMRRRLDKLLPSFGNPDIRRLYYACDWPRGAAGIDAIRAFLIEHPETRIVVIDTIAAFRDPDPGKRNQYTWDYELGALLRPLSREFQCAFVLVSHNRKPGHGDTHVNHEVSGTTGLVGGMDNVFVMKRSSGNVTAVLYTDGRDIEHPQELALQLQDGRWLCVGNAADVNRSSQRNSVLEAVAILKGCGTAREIHEAMGATERLGTLRVRLTRMVKAGELDLNGTIYTRTDPTSRFVTPQPEAVTADVTPPNFISTPAEG